MNIFRLQFTEALGTVILYMFILAASLAFACFPQCLEEVNKEFQLVI